jgi:hypothetical protein
MKVLIEKTDDVEELNIKVIKAGMNLIPCNGENKYEEQPDGSLIIEMRVLTAEARENVICALTALSSWADMKFRELEEPI